MSTFTVVTDPVSPATVLVTGTETVTYAGSGLTFVNTYSSGVTGAYVSAITAAENYFQSHFSNSVTLYMNFGLQSLGPNFASENSFYITQVSYSALKSALASHATTADDAAAVASLPSTDPSGGAGLYFDARHAEHSRARQQLDYGFDRSQ
jgi:hypothetical protein